MIPRTPWSPGLAAWQDDLSHLPPSEWNYDRAAHLLAHAGFGGRPEEIEKLVLPPPQLTAEAVSTNRVLAQASVD